MHRVWAPSFAVVGLVALHLCGGCGGGAKPAATTSPAGSETAPRVVVEDSSETFYEEGAAGKPGESTGVREYVMDVTKRVEWKGGGGTLLDAGTPPPDKILRVAVRFPVPKVSPDGARDPHVVNRLLWDIRNEIAKCYYKGPGKEAGEEHSMIGFLQVNKKGEVTANGVEKADDALTKTGTDACIMANVSGIAMSGAGDDVKIRFKLKMQTNDVTGAAGAKVAPKT